MNYFLKLGKNWGAPTQDDCFEAILAAYQGEVGGKGKLVLGASHSLLSAGQPSWKWENLRTEGMLVHAGSMTEVQVG